VALHGLLGEVCVCGRGATLIVGLTVITGFTHSSHQIHDAVHAYCSLLEISVILKLLTHAKT